MAQPAEQQMYRGFVVSFLVTFAAAALGARASIGAEIFYDRLVQPGWAPPPWLFGPVWTVLYALMAVAAALVWRAGGLGVRRFELGLFLAQLVLNSLWSWLFFILNLGGLAFAEIVLLWVFVLATLMAFWRVNLIAGLCLVPYLMWVSFAATLNFVLWRMNPGVLG